MCWCMLLGLLVPNVGFLLYAIHNYEYSFHPSFIHSLKEPNEEIFINRIAHWRRDKAARVRPMEIPLPWYIIAEAKVWISMSLPPGRQGTVLRQDVMAEMWLSRAHVRQPDDRRLWVWYRAKIFQGWGLTFSRGNASNQMSIDAISTNRCVSK